jgi:transposase InsO family protein
MNFLWKEGGDMPWKETDVLKERLEFLKRHVVGEPMAALCREFGVARPTGYRWVKRFEAEGSVSALRDRSRRPLSSPTRTSGRIEGRVMELRDRYGWGARKIHRLLEREGIELPAVTVHRILKRNGRVRPRDSHRPAVKRFQRERPNELWQMDFKGDYRMGKGRCYPLSIIDDYSRYAVGLEGLFSQKAVEVHGSLVGVFRRYGLPSEMLVDHGAPWWSTTNGHGLTRLSAAIIKQGIKLTYSGVRHPQTQGKVERFNGTIEASVIHHGKPPDMKGWRAFLREFRREYNEVRPHEALGMEVPARFYCKSRRRYMDKPAEWRYPPGGTVMRLNTQGCLDYEGRRRFVCEALAGEQVKLERIGDLVVVGWRGMLIREIDLDSGRTRALVLPE